MANVLVLAPQQYFQGVVTLFRGDQWNLSFQLRSRIGGVDIPQDLSAASGCTGYFPAATGGTIPVTCVEVDASQGLFRAVVGHGVTPAVGLLSSPSTWYVVVSTTDGPQTYETPDMPLVINDAAFNN